MRTQPGPTPRTPQDAATDALPPPWQRLLALSGIALTALFVIGWLTSGANSLHYTAGDPEWPNSAHDNQWKGWLAEATG